MSSNDSDMEKYPQEALDLWSRVDSTLSSCSEKLANLDKLLSRFSAETNVGAKDFETEDYLSEELIENDLLSAILSFELREFESVLAGIQELIFDAFRKISSCKSSTESVLVLVRRLGVSEEVLKQLQDHVLEMEIQLSRLKMTSLSSTHHDWNRGLVRTVKHKGNLRILEKSLARELELEKKLKLLTQNEEDLKLKVRLVEQVASCMEEAAEVAWSRFLEADNTAEVVMGISKDMVAKLHLSQLNLSRSIECKEETNRTLQDFANQLRAKETLIQKLNGDISLLVADNAEVKNLREKMQNLEKEFESTENKLEQANALSETSQKHLQETGVEIEALREKLNATENRAKSSEEKATHLTESNLELSEEVDFLKGTNDSSTKKVSMLEKQLRELEIQFQHSRMLSEASQEQQNMLYSAIWDMETLIDELKQKVARSESKAESSEVNEELELMRLRVEFFEKSLKEANLQKKLCAEDISVSSGRIMEMVMLLSMERERVQKQLVSCTKENKFLREKLQKERKKTSVIVQDSRSGDEKVFQVSVLDSADSRLGKAIEVQATEILSETLQVEKLTEDAISDHDEARTFSSTNRSTNLDKNANHRRKCIFVGILVVVFSSLAAHLFQKELAIL